jgi:hypothetical protein
MRLEKRGDENGGFTVMIESLIDLDAIQTEGTKRLS